MCMYTFYMQCSRQNTAYILYVIYNRDEFAFSIENVSAKSPPISFQNALFSVSFIHNISFIH